MSYQVVIISNRWPNEWYYLHKEFFKSLKGFQALHIQPMQWGGLSTKPKVLYAAIKDGTIKTDHIIFTDCWDMVFAKTPDEVMSHYNSFEKPIVISCERNCFPADLKDDFDKPYVLSPYKYLNSGFIVGETEAILTCLEAMDLPNLDDDHFDPIKGCNVHPNDQFEWQKIWAKQPVQIALDYNQLLSQTLHDETIDTFEFNEKGILNKITETYPCAFHFNGGAKDNHSLREQNITSLKSFIMDGIMVYGNFLSEEEMKQRAEDASLGIVRYHPTTYLEYGIPSALEAKLSEIIENEIALFEMDVNAKTAKNKETKLPKVIYIEPTGYHTPLLFDTFKETFSKEGYVETDDERETDYFFIDLYSYQKSARFVPFVEDKLVFFDFSDYGGMSKEEQPNWSKHNGGNKVIYFMRKMDKTKQYPPYVYPIEHIIECDFPLVTKEELFNREYDVCFVGNESPQRREAAYKLQQQFKCDFYWTSENEKLSHEQWIKRHYNAKMFLESDGGGYGSERPFKLMSTAPMLRQKNTMLRINDWQSGIDCLDISDTYVIGELLKDKDWLYEVYINGHNKLKAYFTAEYRAKYILDVLKQNGL